MVRFQSQAVLRRSKDTGPLRLVGVTLDSTFFPKLAAARGSLGRFTLTRGRVALAPLTAVDASTGSEAAAISMVEATQIWNGPNSPGLPEEPAG